MILGPEDRLFLLRYASWPAWKRWLWRQFS